MSQLIDKVLGDMGLSKQSSDTDIRIPYAIETGESVKAGQLCHIKPNGKLAAGINPIAAGIRISEVPQNISPELKFTTETNTFILKSNVGELIFMVMRLERVALTAQHTSDSQTVRIMGDIYKVTQDGLKLLEARQLHSIALSPRPLDVINFQMVELNTTNELETAIFYRFNYFNTGTLYTSVGLIKIALESHNGSYSVSMGWSSNNFFSDTHWYSSTSGYVHTIDDCFMIPVNTGDYNLVYGIWRNHRGGSSLLYSCYLYSNGAAHTTVSNLMKATNGSAYSSLAALKNAMTGGSTPPYTGETLCPHDTSYSVILYRISNDLRACHVNAAGAVGTEVTLLGNGAWNFNYKPMLFKNKRDKNYTLVYTETDLDAPLGRAVYARTLTINTITATTGYQLGDKVKICDGNLSHYTRRRLTNGEDAFYILVDTCGENYKSGDSLFTAVIKILPEEIFDEGGVLKAINPKAVGRIGLFEKSMSNYSITEMMVSPNANTDVDVVVFVKDSFTGKQYMLKLKLGDTEIDNYNFGLGNILAVAETDGEEDEQIPVRLLFGDNVIKTDGLELYKYYTALPSGEFALCNPEDNACVGQALSTTDLLITGGGVREL